jgi:hypothetical protein
MVDCHFLVRLILLLFHVLVFQENIGYPIYWHNKYNRKRFYSLLTVVLDRWIVNVKELYILNHFFSQYSLDSKYYCRILVFFCSMSVNRWHYVDAHVFNLSFVQLFFFLYELRGHCSQHTHPFFSFVLSLSVYIYILFLRFC